MIEVTLLIPEDCTECKYYHYCTQSAYGLGLCKYKECIEALGQQKADLHSKCRKKHSECRRGVDMEIRARPEMVLL